jgi:diguanylate cyclase (GGDEF)-like protein
VRADRSLCAVLALAIALIVLALLWVQAGQAAASASRRVGFQPGEGAGGVRVLEMWSDFPAARAGLQLNDLVVAVDGVRVVNDLTYQRVAASFQSGRPIRMRVLRHGLPVDLVVYPGVPFPYFNFILNTLTVLCFLGISLLALGKGLSDLRALLLFSFSCAVALELALPLGTIGNPTIRGVSLAVWYLLTGLQIGLELHIAALIPVRHPWLRGRSWLVPSFYAVGVGLGVLGAATYLSDQIFGVRIFPWGPELADVVIMDVGLPLWAAAVCVLLMRQTLRHSEPTGRHQAGLVLSATIPWCLTLLAQSIFNQRGLPNPEWLIRTQLIVVLFYPLALFAAVYLYNLFDIELVVRRSLIYTTLSGALVAVFYAAAGGMWLLFPSLRGSAVSGWVLGLAMLLLGLLFSPLRRLVHRLIDRRFFPERDEMRQRLIALAAELPALGKLPRMGGHLVHEVSRIFGSRAAILFIASPETGLLNVLASTGPQWEEAARALLLSLDDPAIETLSRSSRPLPAAALAQRSPTLAHRLRELDATALGVPLLSHERLIGVLLLSGKQSGLGYPSEEQDLLTLVARHAATVFENARLFESATYESLTGLFRREAILEQLERELERAVRYGRPLSLAMADLDFFKGINDRFGHLAGDTLLKEIAHIAAQGIRSTDLIGRYGGEEFIIVLPETEMTGAVRVAEKIRDLVERTAVPMDDGSCAGVTISIGLAELPHRPGEERMTARDLIAAADRSLYRAKHEGRNRVHPLLVA